MASYAAKIIKTLYPSTNVSMSSPGKTGNVVVYINNVPVWNMNRDGAIKQSTAVKYAMRIRQQLEGY
jgi:predicted Rdx family selenoprotein